MARSRTSFWLGIALIVFPAIHLLYLALARPSGDAAGPLFVSMDVILIGTGLFLLWINKRTGGS